MSDSCTSTIKALPSSPSRAGGHSAVSPLALAILLLGGFITVFDLFVVNVAIPSMQADLGADFAQIGFVIAGYELAFGVLLIAGGRLGDIHGRRKLFILGMLGFAVTSFLCGIAPTAASLIVARFLQGATGAILFPQVYALLRVMYDEAGRRRAFGLLGMTLGLAAIAGQVLGGLIVESDLFGLGWRIIFLINLPIGVVAAAFARVIPESKAPDAASVDWPGVCLATAGLLLLLLPLLEGPNIGWPAWTWGSLIAAVLLLTGFLAWERRVGLRGGHPAIDLRLFANAGFSAGAIVVLLIYSTATSLFLCFALLVQSGFGLTPFEAGSLFAPASVGFVAASLIGPRLVVRFGDSIIAVGALVYAAGILWLIVRVGALAGPGDAWSLLPALILFGFGQGLSMTPLLNLVIGFVEERHAGMAAGIVSTMQQVGGAFGVAVVGIFFVRVLAAHPAGAEPNADRYVAAFSGAMLYNLSAVVIAAALILWIARRARPT
ncbi:MFS transporter [Phyllobacterium phragmitis]|uniref:MFS transporter n=1 Tax=Phyllobacterium phragmitis TaxID=2670329 RepID=A0A2S9IU51_9HYPH|nr:MFS transporter [Phyllobacterium phragmitis]PRD44020.1 MFS transporter [Phyllobacterium phragmitis]